MHPHGVLGYWLGGIPVPGEPGDRRIETAKRVFGPKRGGRYEVTVQLHRVVVTPIPPAELLQGLSGLRFRDSHFKDDHALRSRDCSVAPFTLTDRSLRTSHGLWPRLRGLLESRGAKLDEDRQRSFPAEACKTDEAVARGASGQRFELLQAAVENERGVIGFDSLEERGRQITAIAKTFLAASVLILVASHEEKRLAERSMIDAGRPLTDSLLRERLRDGRAAETAPSMRPAAAMISVGMGGDGPFDDHDPQLVLVPHAPMALDRKAFFRFAVNRGFRHRVFSFLDNRVSLDARETAQIEFLFGPTIYRRGLVDDGWLRYRLRLSGGPSRERLTCNDWDALFSEGPFVDALVERACQLAAGESVRDLHPLRGGGGSQELPKCDRSRSVGIVVRREEDAVALQRRLPDFDLVTASTDVPEELSRRSAVITALAVERDPFLSFDVVCGVGVHPEGSPLAGAFRRSSIRRYGDLPDGHLTFIDIVGSKGERGRT